MLQHARAPETGPAHPLPATYGELMHTVQLQVECAVTLATTTRDPSAAHPQLLGYQRFLGAAGDLIAVLRELNGARPPGLGLLAARLAAIPRGDPETGANPSGWVRVATTLGAAHDLLATHLGPDRELRSPDAHEITADTGAALALRQLSLVLVDAAKATDRLVYAARTVQNRSPEKPVPMALFQRVTEANRRILLQAKAALWDLDHELHAPPSSNLAHLRATTSVHVAGPSDSFESALTALRTLRELAFHQANGRTPASPASVRDLARLAVAVTDPTLDWLPAPANGLERLRRAHATDQLAPAHRAWDLACRDLPLTIQGTTKAPGPTRRPSVDSSTRPPASAQRSISPSPPPSLASGATPAAPSAASTRSTRWSPPNATAARSACTGARSPPRTPRTWSTASRPRPPPPSRPSPPCAS